MTKFMRANVSQSFLTGKILLFGYAAYYLAWVTKHYAGINVSLVHCHDSLNRFSMTVACY